MKGRASRLRRAVIASMGSCRRFLPNCAGTPCSVMKPTAYACGQTMAGSDIAESDLNEFTEMSLSAQIVLTNYALQGYVTMPDG